MRYPDPNSFYPHFVQSTGLSIDSRNINEGEIFFALHGSQVNGAQYAEAALENGAAFAIVDDESFYKGDQVILVHDVLKFMQKLANHHRNQFAIPIIALTGSNGKTTTKEMIACALNDKYKVHFTKGNFNNHIGLPITLLQMPLDTEIAVIEMGANHLKEIELLCKICEPNFGLITNIGDAHLEGFGGPEKVVEGKSELAEYLISHGHTFWLNAMEPSLKMIEPSLFDQAIQYALRSSKDQYRINNKILKVDKSLEYTLRTEAKVISGKFGIYGYYNLPNILTAIFIANYFGLALERACAVLSEYKQENNRSQVLLKGNNTYILDAYNANPNSVQKALEEFQNINAQDKWIILGDMLELGDFAKEKHEAIIQMAKTVSSNCVFVGSLFKSLEEQHPNCHFFEDAGTTKEWLDNLAIANSTFLLKGSRGIGLETILE